MEGHEKVAEFQAKVRYVIETRDVEDGDCWTGASCNEFRVRSQNRRHQVIAYFNQELALGLGIPCIHNDPPVVYEGKKATCEAIVDAINRRVTNVFNIPLFAELFELS